MIAPPARSSEVELKFSVSPGDATTISANRIFARNTTQAQLRSVYYDTPDLDLRANDISLRVRHKDGTFIQTVKRAVGLGLFDRDEWESVIRRKSPDRSAWAGTPVASILSAKGVAALRPVFTTKVQRTTRVLREGSSEVEVSFDRGKLFAGRLHEPIEEVELELKSGEAAALFSIARRLTANATLRLSFESKAERGYQLLGRGARKARKAQPVKIPGGLTAVEGFNRVARSCLVQVSANAELLRRVRNPEVLHQLRVGLRRLRAAFATFKLVLPRQGLDRLKRETKWLSSALDPARDLDVFIENAFHKANEAARGDTMLAAFGQQLLRTQAGAYDLALKALASKRFAMLLLNCAEWVETAPLCRNGHRVAVRLRDGDASTLAAHALSRFRHQLHKSARHLASLDPRARHRVRIQVKKLRYAVEFFTESFGRSTHKQRRKFIASLNVLQHTLGKLNDMAMAPKTALAVAGRSAQLAFRAGQVIGGRDRDEQRLLAEAVNAYKRWWNVRPFWL
jgi:inorganic triphosphatase YgiF